MTEIYTTGGICYQVKIGTDLVYKIVTDEVIQPNTFIKFILPDDSVTYIKKKDIVSFNEGWEEGGS